MPDEAAMKDAEDEEQQVSTGVDIGDVRAAPALCPAGEQDDAHPEEHREETSHFSFKEHPLDHEKGQIEMCMGTSKVVDRRSDRNVVDKAGVSEVVDVHNKYAEQGNAAEDVHARNALRQFCGGDD